LLVAIHAAYPSATIFAQTAIDATVETANTYGNTLGDYRAAISTAAAGKAAYVTVVDGTTLMTAGGLSADGVHPTTAGHATIKGNVLPMLP
jgi:hypothetical protein